LKSDERIIYFVHDDETQRDTPTSVAEIGAGFRFDNAYYSGNEVVSRSTLSGLRFCLEHSGDTDCDHLCYEVQAGEGGAYNGKVPVGLTTDLHKIIGGLTGQLRGQSGQWLSSSKTLGDVCPGVAKDSVPNKCWICYSKAYGNSDSLPFQINDAWHVQGFGMTAYASGNDDFGFWKGGRCAGDFHYDNFYVVASGDFQH